MVAKEAEYIPFESYTGNLKMNVRYTSGVSNKTESQLRNIIRGVIQEMFDDDLN